MSRTGWLRTRAVVDAVVLGGCALATGYASAVAGLSIGEFAAMYVAVELAAFLAFCVTVRRRVRVRTALLIAAVVPLLGWGSLAAAELVIEVPTDAVLDVLRVRPIVVRGEVVAPSSPT